MDGRFRNHKRFETIKKKAQAIIIFPMNIIHQHLALDKLGQKVDRRIDLDALKGTGQTFGQT